jgi:hypothetical protein
VNITEGIKPACVIDGEPWWNYLYEYDWEGNTYTLPICARSREEADARLKRLPLARYDGQADGQPIPVNLTTGVYVRLLVWWRNLFVRAHQR